LIQAGLPTSTDLNISVGTDGNVSFALPRMKSGQGLTTAVAVLIAEEMSVLLSSVSVSLLPGTSALVLNQLTGSSNSIRSLFIPLRAVAASAKARLVAAAQFGLQVDQIVAANGILSAATGQSATYGAFSAAAAGPQPARSGRDPQAHS
jgi:isoquinoline 1-oxidoreductase beta subunit